MAVRIIYEPYPWRVVIDLWEPNHRWPYQDGVVRNWLAANLDDDRWIGFEKTRYSNGHKPIYNRDCLELYCADEEDAQLIKLAFEGR
ncbi:MAG: hypothetical protein EOO77_12105 [Oxalobacteraceae bacterium]|nr:MAG: hypothetical protein EOO77_12105 [Oxalobacteraceae bacterium]